jgi:hypothetical protein
LQSIPLVSPSLSLHNPSRGIYFYLYVYFSPIFD